LLSGELDRLPVPSEMWRDPGAGGKAHANPRRDMVIGPGSEVAVANAGRAAAR